MTPQSLRIIAMRAGPAPLVARVVATGDQTEVRVHLLETLGAPHVADVGEEGAGSLPAIERSARDVEVRRVSFERCAVITCAFT